MDGVMEEGLISSSRFGVLEAEDARAGGRREPDDTTRRRRGGRRGSRWCQNCRALVYWVARIRIDGVSTRDGRELGNKRPGLAVVVPV